MQELTKRLDLDRSILDFLAKLFRVLIVALAVIIIAQEWDYDVNGFLAGLGLGGLAIALAAKDAAANIFGGIVIVLDKPFSVGDWIHTPTVEGTVEEISFRSTKIRTFAQAPGNGAQLSAGQRGHYQLEPDGEAPGHFSPGG